MTHAALIPEEKRSVDLSELVLLPFAGSERHRLAARLAWLVATAAVIAAAGAARASPTGATNALRARSVDSKEYLPAAQLQGAVIVAAAVATPAIAPRIRAPPEPDNSLGVIGRGGHSLRNFQQISGIAHRRWRGFQSTSKAGPGLPTHRLAQLMRGNADVRPPLTKV